jgi:3-deoxy-D-manno-octulosonic-acid transferase
MTFFYNLFVRLYGLGIFAAAPFNRKAAAWISGRKEQKRFLRTSAVAPSCIWIHCASAGEFEQALPLIEAIRQTDHSYSVAVSFFSPSGYALYRDSKFADFFFYLPLDTKKNARELIHALRPSAAIFIRNEIWLNLLKALKDKKIETFLVNAPSNKPHGIYGRYLRHAYMFFTKIFYAAEGTTKLERVAENKLQDFEDSIFEEWCRGGFILIAGSSWHAEEELIHKFWQNNRDAIKELKIIIAPHEIDDTKSMELKRLFGKDLIPYSSYNSECRQRILLLDKKGMLKYIYRYGSVAFIGGGFGKGIHNAVEAAIYGIPVLIGPNFHKFEEIVAMVQTGTALPVHTYNDIEKTVRIIYSDAAFRNAIRKKSQLFFESQQKVSTAIAKQILDKI